MRDFFCQKIELTVGQFLAMLVGGQLLMFVLS